MDTIFSLFDFSTQSVGLVFGRFGVEVLLTVIVAFIVAFVILAVSKNSEPAHKIGFTNWFKVSWLYGIDAAILSLGIVVILTIRTNGLYYFHTDSFTWDWFWSWYCGYLLLLPEMILFILWIIAYWLINKQIYKSIN